MPTIFTPLSKVLLWVASFLLITQHASAEIVIKLKEPDWQFILSSQSLTQTTAKIQHSEIEFSQQIKPLLVAQDYEAVMREFSQRDITKDSAALCQLRGQVQLMLEQYEEAEKSLQRALSLLPEMALAHRNLGMVYMMTQSYQKAQQHLKKTIELGVSDSQLFGQLAYINVQLGYPASAVAGYQNALFLEPNNIQWQQGLLYAFINSHAFDQAQALLEQMLQSDIENAQLWLQRGQLALKKERFPQAISSLEMALILDKKNVENIVTTAQLHIQSGSSRRAVNLMVNNMSLFFNKQDGQKVAVLEQISAWLTNQEDWPKLKDLLSAVDSNREKLSKSYQAKFDVYHAKMAIAKHELTTAKKRLQQALKNDPSHGEALLTLANLLKQEQRDEQALRYFVRAQALIDYKERALIGQAQLEIDRQKYSQALRLLHQVIKFNPARRDVLVNIQSLESIVRNQT